MCLDVSSAAGRAVFQDLVRVSDAVFSNLRGDVPEKLGLKFADLEPINPAIVCCSLSGYGMTGPRAAFPGFDYMVQGYAGWMSITGEPNGPPSKTGLSAVDFASGFAASLALLAGVHAARRDGIGVDCDISLMDTALSMLNYLVTWTGSRGYEPSRMPRSFHPTLVPFGNFPTADGWIVAGGSKPKFWERLARSLDRHDLLVDPRFSTFESRLINRDALTELMDIEFRKQPTSHWLRILEDADVPCAPVNTIAEALVDEQVVARQSVFRLDHPSLGEITHVASPIRVGTEPHRRAEAPALGADTAAVLTKLLGYTDDRIRGLEHAGVIAGAGLGD